MSSPYLEVPVAQYSVPHLAANPYPPNVFTADQLKALYGSKAAYRARVGQALGGLTRAGWFLPVYRDVVLGDVEALDFLRSTT